MSKNTEKLLEDLEFKIEYMRDSDNLYDNIREIQEVFEKILELLKERKNE